MDFANSAWLFPRTSLDSLQAFLSVASKGGLEVAGRESPKLECAYYYDDGERRRESMATGAIAVIRIRGLLMYQLCWYGASYRAIEYEIDRLVAARAKAIVFEIDSPGGNVIGLGELAAKIKAVSLPTIAVICGQATSAAYWLASQCDSVYSMAHSMVGGIGTYILNFDYTGAFEKDGIKLTVIEAPEGKTDGQPFAGISDEMVARLQESANAVYEQFSAAVATGRRQQRRTVQNKWKAAVYSSEQALALGMVDGISTLSEVLVGLGKKRRSMTARNQRRLAAARVGGVAV